MPKLLIGLGFALLAAATGAQQLDTVIQAEQQANRDEQASQDRVDQIVDQTRSLESQYIALGKEIDGLEVYNALLQRQVDAQEQELQDLDESMDQVTVIERQVIPLMVRMIDALEQFVELDVPFLLEERRDRIADLRGLLERSDVTAAEKFRRVMEAYQIENDYGRTIEAYRGTQDVGGVEREVDFLRIGRIGLYYQTPDTTYSGVWNSDANQWQALEGAARSQIRDGLRIARKQTAPDLLLLPVTAPEDA
ncbi:MAG: DUF3450 domain-containing protein [Xanthomonadales bacterium]|nr:DUF3450 domain-containing protein [Xanthomonadales bacterium]